MSDAKEIHLQIGMNWKHCLGLIYWAAAIFKDAGIELALVYGALGFCCIFLGERD